MDAFDKIFEICKKIREDNRKNGHSSYLELHIHKDFEISILNSLKEKEIQAYREQLMKDDNARFHLNSCSNVPSTLQDHVLCGVTIRIKGKSIWQQC